MASKPDDPKPGGAQSGAAIPQHKKYAMGQPIPQGSGKGVTTK